MKRFSVITAFPEIFNGFLSSSIIGRAISSGLIEVELLNLRDFAEGKHRQVDDYTYGGGGMVLMAEPLYKAVQAACSISGRAMVISPSPQGVMLSQEVVESLAQEDHLIIACGHYEGGRALRGELRGFGAVDRGLCLDGRRAPRYGYN